MKIHGCLLKKTLMITALSGHLLAQTSKQQTQSTPESFGDFIQEQQRNVGFGSPDVSIGVEAQLIGVKPIPSEWDWEPMHARIARQLAGDNIHVIEKCRSGNCGHLAILAHLKCEPEGICVYSVSSEFRVRVKPLRILEMNPVFAAVWSAPAYDCGIVKRDNIKHVLEIVDEVTSVFCLYYNQGRLMH
jgi:hypothetical protein